MKWLCLAKTATPRRLAKLYLPLGSKYFGSCEAYGLTYTSCQERGPCTDVLCGGGVRANYGRLMLTVLGGLAEFERELIMARTGEGRLRAKARGVRFGRPRSLTPHQRQEAMQRLADGEVQADLARSYSVSQSTISRLSGDRPFGAGAAVA